MLSMMHANSKHCGVGLWLKTTAPREFYCSLQACMQPAALRKNW